MPVPPASFIDPLSALEQFGPAGILLALIGFALMRGFFRLGSDVDRLLEEKDERLAEMEAERDDYKEQVEVLHHVADQAVEIAVQLAAGRRHPRTPSA